MTARHELARGGSMWSRLAGLHLLRRTRGARRQPRSAGRHASAGSRGVRA
ncbi:MAG TPA: hypothetical protein VIJ82_09625 [Streptosporangiaceae bacterium]|jgi:hypothetical protein